MPSTLLITGAAGGMATLLRPLLARTGRTLRLIDVADIPQLPGTGNEEHLSLALEDRAAMRAACNGVDAILHLGGLSLEGPWEDILRVNIDGTHTVLDAARAAGVPRVILASTNHVVGFIPTAEAPLSTMVQTAPDTYYGVSKLAVEALGSLFHHRYGLDVIVARIGSCFAEPRDQRMLSTWLSPHDAARLVEAALAVPQPGFRVVWGQSANTRGVFSLEAGREIGFVPEDDAEDFAPALEAKGLLVAAPLDHLIGGSFTSPDLDAAL